MAASRMCSSYISITLLWVSRLSSTVSVWRSGAESYRSGRWHTHNVWYSIRGVAMWTSMSWLTLTWLMTSLRMQSVPRRALGTLKLFPIPLLLSPSQPLPPQDPLAPKRHFCLFITLSFSKKVSPFLCVFTTTSFVMRTGANYWLALSSSSDWNWR